MLDFSTTQGGELQKLSFTAIVKAALAALLAERRLLLHLALIPFLVIAGSQLLAFLLEGRSEGSIFRSMIMTSGMVISTYGTIWFMSRSFQLFFGQKDQGQLLDWKWSSNEWRLLARLFLSVLIVSFFVAIVGNMTGLTVQVDSATGDIVPPSLLDLMILALLVMVFLTPFVFAIAAASIGRGYGLARSLRESCGVMPQLVAVNLFVAVPLQVLSTFLLQAVAFLTSGIGLKLPIVLASVGLQLFSISVIASLIVAAFRQRTGISLDRPGGARS